MYAADDAAHILYSIYTYIYVESANFVEKPHLPDYGSENELSVVI